MDGEKCTMDIQSMSLIVSLAVSKAVVQRLHRREPHPKTARAKAVACKGSSGAAVMKAHAMAVTEQPAAVILVISASPLGTFSTVLPSVICMLNNNVSYGKLAGK